MKLAMPPVDLKGTIKTTLDLDRVVFDGDRDLRAALLRDRDVVKAMSEAAAGAEEPALAIRRSLLMTSARLTPQIAPELYECVKHCTDTLGITHEIEIYCSQNADMNAFIVPPQGKRLCIGFSSAALERFDEGELKFVLGHELGHAIFKHSEMPLHLLEGNPHISPLNVMRFHAWKRYAELSCDRVGLLCCRDLEVAAHTFFKLTSGLSGPRWMRHVSQSALHYAAQEAADFGRGDQDDWFSTHPYSPLRVKALDLFARSKTYHRLIGSNGGSLTEAQLEQEVAGIVELMNPAVLSEKISCRAELKEFLAICSLAVARIDGKVSRSESRAVHELLGAHAAEKIKAIDAMSPDEVGARVSELGNELQLKLAPMRRLKVCEDLCSIAIADGKVTSDEQSILYQVASLLGIEPGFIDAVLQRTTSGLD